MTTLSIIGQHAHPRLYDRKQRPHMVHGIMVHQTGCAMSTSISKWANCNAHIGVSSKGDVFWLNHPVDFICHGNLPSPWTIGIEVSGNWYGLEGVSKTLWKGGGKAAKMTPEIAAGILLALEKSYAWIMGQVPVSLADRKSGAVPHFSGVYAHRQSTDMRLWDPGQAIWEICHKFNCEKGTTGCELETWSDGAAIPQEWRAAC